MEFGSIPEGGERRREIWTQARCRARNIGDIRPHETEARQPIFTTLFVREAYARIRETKRRVEEGGIRPWVLPSVLRLHSHSRRVVPTQ